MSEYAPVLQDVRKCEACGAPIIFVKTAATGKWQPLDAKPERRMVINEDQLAVSTTTWTPHHATCPHAERFRRP